LNTIGEWNVTSSGENLHDLVEITLFDRGAKRFDRHSASTSIVVGRSTSSAPPSIRFAQVRMAVTLAVAWLSALVPRPVEDWFVGQQDREGGSRGYENEGRANDLEESRR
jgi:hypothetical protein